MLMKTVIEFRLLTNKALYSFDDSKQDIFSIPTDSTLPLQILQVALGFVTRLHTLLDLTCYSSISDSNFRRKIHGMETIVPSYLKKA